MIRLPILWNKLGSAAEVTASEIGGNGTATGGAYAACKFGNGFEVNANSEYVDFDIGKSINAIGAVEFWWKPFFASSDTSRNTFVSDQGASVYFPLIDWRGDQAYKLRGWKNGWSDQLESGAVTFSASDLMHTLVCWDFTNGIGTGTDKARYYLNGELKEGLNITNDVNNSQLIMVGNRQQNDYDADSIIDNIKIYDFAKTWTSDRFMEGTCNPQIRS